jgi:hypothetical protein
MRTRVFRQPLRCAWTGISLGLVFASLLAGCSPNGREPPPAAPLAVDDDLPEQVHRFCGGCHAYPPPDTFRRRDWKKEVQQGYGFYNHFKPSLPVPPVDQVIAYYEERAPEEMTLPKITYSAAPLPVSFGRQHFPEPAHTGGPAISHLNLVSLFDSRRPDVLACDMRRGEVLVLRPYEPKPAWKVLGRVPHPAHAEVVDLDRDGVKDILVANLGSFKPTELLLGSVVWLRGRRDGTFEPFTLLEGVGRVADVQAADFNGDGKLDLVVAVFGWNDSGEICYLENQTTDWSKPRFDRHVIDSRHGTIHVPVADLNKDGRPDFVALISQEHEAIVAFFNDGKGSFRKETIYAGPHPGYGSSGIQLVDLNGDRELDVLYTNGDVLDEPCFLKPYHSIQWLENPGNIRPSQRGSFPWTHHHLATMYGAHRAVAADLDHDGDMDIVASSFLPPDGFPQRSKLDLDAVIVLEQTAPGRFVRHRLETATCDHPSCVVGDVFGSGRPDLVVGNFTENASDRIVTFWKNEGLRSKAPARR